MAVTDTGDQCLIPEREPEKWLLHLRTAAGAKITQSQFEEVVTRNNNFTPYGGKVLSNSLEWF
jgi:hypothetical protein